MPPPRVELTVNTDRFISENTVTLFCTVTLHSSVNDNELVLTRWFGPGRLLSNPSGAIITTVKLSDGVFQSSFRITNFNTTLNNGDYTCNATVISSSSYVVGNTASDSRKVNIPGKASTAELLMYK